MSNITGKTDEIRKINKYNIIALILIFIVSPLTVFLCFHFMGAEKYFVVSAFLVIIVISVFFLVFEGKRPDARIIIIISVMSAIAVVGRAIFFFAPNIKPTLAIVILSGICFGRNVGFITGATSAFVSNFIFGQGPWTPWQMIAMGVVGYLAGLFFDDGKNGRRSKRYANNNRLMTIFYCVFGFVAAFFIYGGIVDLWTLFGFYGEITFKSIIAVYVTASVFNLFHGVSTVVFLLIFVIPLKSRLDRIKIKYGLVR